jgi:hypothetical protein
MENSVFWEVASCMTSAHVGSSFADFSILKMEAIRSSETSVLTNLHGAISEKTEFFIVTTVKTSNLTQAADGS